MSSGFRTTALAAVAVVGLVGWLGLPGFAFSDYDAEVAPAYAALARGEVAEFLRLAPAYGGSLILRAPAAMAPTLWNGGELAVFRAAAVPCLLAAFLLALVLARWRERRFGWDWTAAVVLLLCAANPIVLRALQIGHPEELFGGALCVGAVLAAIARRPYVAALLLGLALANKAWAVLAIGPVLLALPDHRTRARAGALAAAVAGAVLLPLLVVGESAAIGQAAHQTSAIFQPWQVWWALGDAGNVVLGGDGLPKVGYRTPPAWLSPIPHPLIAGLMLPLSLLWYRRRSARPVEDVLLLLALLFLLRCALDPWNIGYYHLPFLLSLLAWEGVRFRRPPAVALAATMLVWFSFEKSPRLGMSPDMQSLLYLLWCVPLIALLARWTYGRPAHEAAPAHPRTDAAALRAGLATPSPGPR